MLENKSNSSQAVDLSRLPNVFLKRILTLLNAQPQVGSDGGLYPIDRITKISPSQGMWLHDYCVRNNVRTSLEIGLAYGYSTAFILAAGQTIEGFSHVAIDPFQHSYWKGIGLRGTQDCLANSADAERRFRFIEARSDAAAIDLQRTSSKFELIFIDGNHRFDDVLVDFYLFAPLCTLSGSIVLDDACMPSISTVAAYIRRNRKDFQEIATPERNIFVFQKIAEDNRDWRHFEPFEVFRT